MLAYLGLSAGNFWDYVRIPGGQPERDSVKAIYNLPLYGSCTDVSGKMVKLAITHDTVLDSALVWAGDGYYHDLQYRFAKYNAATGDTWEAWNDCLLPMNTPVPVPDLDRDSVSDTIIYRPSTAVVESTDAVVGSMGGNIKVVLTLHSKVVMTSSLSPDSLLLTEYRSYYYVPDFGITKVMLDSVETVVYKGSFSYSGTSPVGRGKVLSSLGINERLRASPDKEYDGPTYDVSGRRTDRNGRLRKGRLVIF